MEKRSEKRVSLRDELAVLDGALGGARELLERLREYGGGEGPDSIVLLDASLAILGLARARIELLGKAIAREIESRHLLTEENAVQESDPQDEDLWLAREAAEDYHNLRLGRAGAS